MVLKNRHSNFEASEDIMTKFKSQGLHIIRIKYLNASGSGPPAFLRVHNFAWMYVSIKDRGGKDTDQKSQGANVSATLIMGMGCQQCLLLSVVQLKGNHCRKPCCRNGIVYTFGHWLLIDSLYYTLNIVDLLFVVTLQLWVPYALRKPAQFLTHIKCFL